MTGALEVLYMCRN